MNSAPVSQGRNSTVNNDSSQVERDGRIFGKLRKSRLDACSSLDMTVSVLADPVECGKYLGIAGGEEGKIGGAMVWERIAPKLLRGIKKWI